VATPSTQIDPLAARERVLDVLRGLLIELGSEGALPMLGPQSHLDRELGLGSLERVELLTRLESEFGVRLPDRVAAEVNTPAALTAAVLAAPTADSLLKEPSSALRSSAAAQRLARQGADEGIFAAQTLIDVLRYRAPKSPIAATRPARSASASFTPPHNAAPRSLRAAVFHRAAASR